MRVSHLQLADFRSYEMLDLAIGAGVTTIVGRNGQGKTNLIEAIRYLSTLSSHRVATDAPLVRSGAARAVARAKILKGDRALTVEVTIEPGKQRAARLGGSPVRPREILGTLRTVVFSPEDLSLVKGDPAGRRAFIDDFAIALAPAFAGDLSDYDRVLRQRTAMLKTARLARGDLATLDIWDEKLAHLGGRMMSARRRALALLAPHVEVAYADLAPGASPCTLSYVSTVDDSDAGEAERAILAQLAALRPKEIERGVCLVGPHRDDIDIRLGDLPAKGYASHGESWSCALALRLATYAALTADDGPDADRDGEPVLILDDVFAELDAGRRTALAARLTQASQVLITAAVPEDVPAALEGATVSIVGGNVTTHE